MTADDAQQTRTRKPRRFNRRLAALLLALYSGGYLVARVSYVIVHRQGFSGGDQIGSHFVEAGDLGPTTPAWAITYWIVELAYSPLRYVELGCWQVLRPIGTPWPDHPR